MDPITQKILIETLKILGKAAFPGIAYGLIDSLTLLQFCINCGAQYTGLTLGEAAGYMGDIGPGVLLAPVKGLGTGYFKINI